MKSHSINRVERHGVGYAGSEAVDLSAEYARVSRSGDKRAADPGSSAQEMDAVFEFQQALAGLVTQRTNAYLEWPSAFSRCESPREVIEEQSRFFHTAVVQYADCSRSLMSAFFGCFGPAFAAINVGEYPGLEQTTDARDADEAASTAGVRQTDKGLLEARSDRRKRIGEQLNRRASMPRRSSRVH